MSSTLFPIAEVSGNKIISVEGNVARFYRLKSPDLEQKTPSEQEIFWEYAKSALEVLDENSYFKFYRLGGKSWLEVNGERPHFPEVELIPEKRPLQTFFGGEGLFSDIGIYDDYLSFNGRYFRILSALEFGEGEITPASFKDGIDYVLFVRKLSKEKAMGRLERIRTSHFSSFFKSKRDVSSEGAYSQAEGLLEEVTHGNESLFEMELFFIVSGFSVEELDGKTHALQRDILEQKIKICIEGQSLVKRKSGLARFFGELIPGVKPKLGLRKHLNKSGHITCLLPLGESHLMDSGVKFEDISNRDIFFNPFSREVKNRNMLITGASGTGKSVLANKLIHSLIDTHPTVILDRGGSFQRLTLYHQGEVLSRGFNPMQFKCPLYLRELILSLADAKNFDKLERGKLLREIKLALEKGVQKFDDLLKYLQKPFPRIDFYFEEVGDFFTDEILEEHRILYVDLENYPKGFVAPLIIFVLEYFKNIEEAEKILVFDECWSFLRDHSAYIDECFRTFRKTGAFPVAISQSLKDFAQFEGCYQAIANNSYFHMIFPQEVQDLRELSSFDKERIQSLGYEKDTYAECYLKTPDNKFRKVLRIYLNALERELFRTDYGAEVKLLSFIERSKEFFDSIPETINAYVRLKNENTKENRRLLDMFADSSDN